MSDSHGLVTGMTLIKHQLRMAVSAVDDDALLIVVYSVFTR